MKIRCKVLGEFECSVERAFQAPILGDARKFLNGYFMQPPISEFIDDDTWGQVGGHRFPATKGNFWLPAGILFADRILERQENVSWKWKIDEFRPFALFFLDHAIGEWNVKQGEENRIAVTYSYTFYPKNWLKYILNWFFCQIQWKGMMRKAFQGIRQQAESNAPFFYARGLF